MTEVRQNAHVLWSVLGAAAALLVWDAVLLTAARTRRQTFTLEISLRKQHYIQAFAHTSILVYWGWYWREVYGWAPLIIVQLVFAYACDMLIAWSRRQSYTLGFGPFPIIGSINLFLWFKPDWYYLQLLMVAIGMLAKEFIRWNKEGRPSHIFNPSSFPLAVFSLILILTSSTDITWGQDVATKLLDAPYIYFFIFLIALPGQLFFGVTAMTMSAVGTAYIFSLAHHAVTGAYFFPDEFIPIAVFLGMHLLFTDPSTAPRTELGRIVFGILYALSVIALFALLNGLHIPSFYDKLLGVPILNLMIKMIDRMARSKALRWLDPAAIGRALQPRRRNLAYMAIWSVGFIGLSAVHVNMPEEDGTTALHWAVRRNELMTVRLLLHVGANARAANDYGVTPLAVASSDGNAPVVDALLTAGADANASIAEGLSMLMLAAGSGRADAVQTLVAHGANVNGREPVLGETALIWAAKENHPEAIDALLRAGADINARAVLAKVRPHAADKTRPGGAAVSAGGETALMYAIRGDAEAASRALVTAGADLNLAGPDGATALELATLRAHFDLAALLIDRGADPNIADESGTTPLYAAVDMNTFDELPGAALPHRPNQLQPVDIVRKLLSRGANPNVALTSSLLTRGYMAARRDDGMGATPFMRAAWKGDTAVMRLLLEHGADPAAWTTNHVTALMFVADFGGPGLMTEQREVSSEALDDRIEAAAKLALGDINAVNNNGETALHVAVANRHERLVRFLVENGAKVNARDHTGRTPLDIAVSRQLEKTAAIFRQGTRSAPRQSAGHPPS
jgi:ankyrin repeat protein